MIKLILMYGYRLIKLRAVQVIAGLYLIFVLTRILGFTGGMYALLILGVLLVISFIYRGSILGGYAYYLHGRRQYDKAMRMYQAALKNGCKNYSTYLMYGMLNLNKGKYEEAKKLFEWVIDNIKLDKAIFSARSNLSIVYWKQGNLDKAIEIATGLIKDFKTTNVYVNLGYYLIQKGDLDEALRVSEEGFDFNSDSAGIMDNLGQIHMLKGDMDKAGEYFIKAAEKSGSISDICYDYGTYLEKLGRLEEALEQYEKALTHDITHINTITEEQVRERIETVKNEMARDYKRE